MILAPVLCRIENTATALLHKLCIGKSILESSVLDPQELCYAFGGLAPDLPQVLRLDGCCSHFVFLNNYSEIRNIYKNERDEAGVQLQSKLNT